MKYGGAGMAGAVLLSGLMHSTRLKVINGAALERAECEAGAAVVALWHGQLLAPSWAYRGRQYATMASRSADGEYITRMLHHWGYRVARGSSSRGGDTALRELAALVRAGHTAALTADGPRGPRHKLKFGVLRLAQLTGAPIVPVAAAADRAWRLRSWDRFILPKPFSRVRVVFGDAIAVASDLSDDARPELAAHIERVMAELERAAEAAL